MISILGTGNLAIDLREHIYDSDQDVIINTVGGRESLNADELFEINIGKNSELCKQNPRATIIAFSSNAVLEPKLTIYASVKHQLELLQEKYNNLHVFRVNTLYGRHKPQFTFPYKIIKNKPRLLPENPIIPTPTDWLAMVMMDMIARRNFINTTSIAPLGQTTALEWGRLILSNKISGKGYDPERTRFSIKSDEIPSLMDWLTLWKQRQDWYS